VIVTVSAVLDAPVERVWPLLDDFANWHQWIPRLESIVMADGLDQAPVGSTRIVGLGGGNSIRERLIDKNASLRRLSYTFEGPQPYPVRRYVGSVRVEPVTTTGQSYAAWSGDFDSDAADEATARRMFEKVYVSFLQALAEAIAATAAA
jgi:hypothetical protein